MSISRRAAVSRVKKIKLKFTFKRRTSTIESHILGQCDRRLTAVAWAVESSALYYTAYSLVPNIRPDGIKDPKDIFPEI